MYIAEFSVSMYELSFATDPEGEKFHTDAGDPFNVNFGATVETNEENDLIITYENAMTKLNKSAAVAKTIKTWTDDPNYHFVS